MSGRAASTAQRLQRTALQLFSERGYDAVTVAAIAHAADVSHMTFFRHFPTKEAVVVSDAFDPLIAHAVAHQSVDLPPLHRAAQGLLTALDHPSAHEHTGSVEFRTRIRLAASTPSLRTAVRSASQVTEDEIARVLVTETVARRAARAAAGAVMGAATAVLLDWADDDSEQSAALALTGALQTLMESRP
ncbi:MAG: TetR/AcrR family transcriptional regulator [Brachybacterium sp.]